MWIKSISLNNIRSFSELKEIEFSSGINVLIGANNSGKSTILRAISCLQPFEMSPDFITRDFCNKYARVGEDTLDFRLRLAEPKRELLTITEFFDAGKWDEINIHFTGRRNGPLNRLFKLANNSEVQIAQPHICNMREPNNFIYPYFSRRKPTEFEERVDSNQTMLIEETHKAIYAKVDRISNQSLPESNEFRKICKSIFGFEISCHPSQSGKQASYAVNRNTHIPINSMGDGTINILSLLVHLLIADGQVFLIEELENDIHPKALKVLLELIVEKSKKNQFLISTHNNIVVKYAGAAPDAKLFSVSMEIENKIPTSKVAVIANSPESRIKVLEDLGYDVFDFELWKAYLILEESSAESIIRSILIPQFAPTLSYKLRTIAAGGNAEVAPRLIDFLRLFVFVHSSSQYKNRAWVAIDGDEKGIKIVDGLKEKFHDCPKEHFRTFSQSVFEKYYPAQFQEEVSKIFALQNSEQRRTEKSFLVQKVITWANENSAEAKVEFEKSASEVINFLNEIEKKI